MIDSKQRASGVHTWLVPHYEAQQHPAEPNACATGTDMAEDRNHTTNNPTEHSNKHEVDVVAMPSVSAPNVNIGYRYYGQHEHTEEEEAYEVEDEMLELNPEWAQRFSKAIKKMKQKVHKSRQRATWKKDKH